MNERDRARRRQHEIREQAAKRQASLRRLQDQTLASGWTWNQVLTWHGFNYSAALAYWDECRRLEQQYPGFRYWEPQPNNATAGYYTHDGTGYYYVINGQYYPVPDHPDNYKPGGPLSGGPSLPHGQPQEPPFGTPPRSSRPPGGRLRRGAREPKGGEEQKPTPPLDEREERLLSWPEGQRAWEIWNEGMKQSEPDEPDDEDTASDENSSR